MRGGLSVARTGSAGGTSEASTSRTTVDHRQAALDLTAEVGVAGVSMILMVMPSG